ncbi:REP element-mobilizing transposase RayT [Desulfocicer vacuolatum DSM 3385]|uniref:REP element-mobilizing transposase RayT n=1 Tax=Desulfocicer vacuolatum DSM 3385 TaxID=1121400 RepID=A0A1W1Z168_9BACT|nr:transposase [Desulfocicer vacuolatum]SMC42134.1 REP element-mobilizing transposase RayT [Desulfocicer vacuolatum DSM 3385]
MARKPRIHYPGAIYHVMIRGNAKQPIFHGDEEYRYFEDILAQGLEQHSLILHAYCWMKNHVHMALQVTDKPLSKLMQNISQRYTYWFNKRYDRVGHLFQGRYKAILVDKDAYFTELIRYIHLNPVRSNLVSDPIDYPLSSHAAYTGRVKSPGWLTVDKGLGQFGKTEIAAQAAYLHFMGQTTEKELLEQLRHGTGQGRILGSEDFIKGALKQNKEKISTKITIEQIVDVVAKVYQVSPMELTSASRARHPAEARAVIALIGMDCFDFLLSDFAHYFNRNMPSMSRLVKDVRTRLTKNRSMHEKIECIKKRITAISEA